ncbi:VPLPA-CTERM sorting domain-containing protein [Rhodovulum sp. DZ06]|uniref:VPLPA-CTERM sorting domain-containing protein n=1 Tax=Rhodovulum sp. DZ06 TaxID=3425126 RepID=UPI003D3330C8
MRFASIAAAALVAAAAAAAPASAAIYTFEDAADYSADLAFDVFHGDSGTMQWSGYEASNGFEGSDGDFLVMNTYNTGNSIRFLDGPVMLNSFEISSAYGSGGAGVYQAERAGHDYRLTLFDADNKVLFDQELRTARDGSWNTVELQIGGVVTMRFAERNDDCLPGYWPGIDNLTVNGGFTPPSSNLGVSDVPLPAAAPMMIAGLAGLGFLARRRKG